MRDASRTHSGSLHSMPERTACVLVGTLLTCGFISSLCCPALQIAAEPNTLYPMLIDSPVVATLASLLSHDNTDIAMEVMDLLQEITDAGGCCSRLFTSNNSTGSS